MTPEQMKKLDDAIKRAKGGSSADECGKSVDSPPAAKKTLEQYAESAAITEEERARQREKRVAELQALRERRAQENSAHRQTVAQQIKTSVASSRLSSIEDRLPKLSLDAQTIFDMAKEQLQRGDIEVLTAHLSAHTRRLAVQSASSTVDLKLGQRVTVKSGNPRAIGKTGVLSKLQRVRCFVTLDNGEELYLYTSDVAPTVEVPTTTEAVEEERAAGEMTAATESVAAPPPVEAEEEEETTCVS